MSKKFTSIILILIPFFLQSSNREIMLPLKVLRKIFGYTDYSLAFPCVCKSFFYAFDIRLGIDIKSLKQNINAHVGSNIIETQNPVAKELRLLDKKIIFNEPSQQYLKFKSENLFNPLSLENQDDMERMQSLLHFLINRNCLNLPLEQRGLTSDYVAELLNLQNYLSFYRKYLFNSLYPNVTSGALIHSHNPVKVFKEKTYGEFCCGRHARIDPYFKIEFKFDNLVPYLGNYRYFFICNEIRYELSTTTEKATPFIYLTFKQIVEYIIFSKRGHEEDNISNQILAEINKDFLPKQ